MSEQQPPQPESQAETQKDPEAAAGQQPRIYVASLSDYNAGRLHGRWMDAARDTEDITSDIHALLANSPEPIAEEWAIHDYEGFGPARINEFEDLRTVSAVAMGIAEHGEAFGAWASVVNNQTDGLEHFNDAYLGTWENVEAYAETLLEDFGAKDAIERLPEPLPLYVDLDIEGFARDLVLGGDITAVEGDEGVHIFDGHG